MSRNKIWAISVSAVMLAAVVVGLIFSGSPEQARKYNADITRVNLLSQINASIDSYYREKKELPESLAVLQEQPAYYVYSIVDPITQQPFEYSIKSPSQYELCATFDLESVTDGSQGQYYPYDRASFWQHPAGRHCYALEASTATTKPLPLEVQP